MAQGLNGALLALGVMGAVALAGRVRRGSFAHGWHGRARELLNAAADEQYVDSGDLIEVLEAIKDDHSVTGRTRARVVSLLLGSQDEGYLDSGEAMEVIEAALGHGSRSYGSIENEISVIDPVTKKKKLLKRHEGESGPEFMGRVWVEIEEWLTGKRLGKPAAGTEVLIWTNYGYRMRAHPSSDVDYDRYVATGQPYSNRWKYAGSVKGSRAIYGMSPDAAGRTLRLGSGKPRSNAGEALNDYRWHPQRALAQFAVSKKKGKGKGGSRAKRKPVQGTVGGGMMFYPSNTPGGPPRLGVATGRYVAVVAGDHVALPSSVSGDYDLAREYARRTYGTDHVELGHHGGSRAFLIDDPEYTHYVVHVPSMKIASGWSYAEDAKEALDDMGAARAHCKVYTRKYLRDHGRDPRHNGSWASFGHSDL
jgi:hypothetical protein